MAINSIIILLVFYGLFLVNASTPGFNVAITKTWTGGSITYSECSAEIINASKLKINNWYVEVPFNGENIKY